MWHMFGSLVLFRGLLNWVSDAAAAEAADVAEAVLLELVALGALVTAAAGPVDATIVGEPVVSGVVVSSAALTAVETAFCVRKFLRKYEIEGETYCPLQGVRTVGLLPPI